MRGIVPLFLGIFGTFLFSWAGLALIPNYQIGHLEPQMDEEGNDAYPAPKSGMADRGRRIYAANGCVYCHSQQIRADYAASDIDRKWGERRSAPRDYIFERPVMIGKMRMGPDLSNIGKRAPAEDENAPPAAAVAAASPDASAPSGSPAAIASPAASPIAATASVASPAPGASAPATSPAKPVAVSATSSPAANLSAPAAPNTANPAATTATSADTVTTPTGEPIPYSAPWHHRHLYSPRSINLDSNMPAYSFLYTKRQVGGERSADALKLRKADDPGEGWEIVPTYEAKCLVAYLMSLDQSHALKEVKTTTPAAPAAPGKAGK